MRRLGIELTDRCNLACTHCLREINHDRSNIPAATVRATLREAARMGFMEVVFTGGEPTLHPDFVALGVEAMALDLRLTVVTNGIAPEPLWRLIEAQPGQGGLFVSMSIEGGNEASFTLVRGRHAYRRFMQTLLGLQARNVPVGFSCTIGAWNVDELASILDLAANLGVRGVSVAAYQPTARDVGEIDMPEYAQLIDGIEAALTMARVPVIRSFEPLTSRATHQCSTLALEDLNINHLGQVTFCCQLSSLHRSPNRDAVVVGNLAQLGLARAVGAQIQRVGAFMTEKLEAWSEGPPMQSDRQPCFYCLRSFGQRSAKDIRHAA
jgi:MoaA/NifB/PqqE/SkfB family radical SAM enzyme